jgi:hypothetical protein
MGTYTFTRHALSFLVTCALLASTAPADAAADPERVCQGGRYAAKAKYDACEQLGTSHLFTTGPFGKNLEKFNQALAKCDAKYRKAWEGLQKKASGTGSLCDAPRYLASM